MHNIGSLWEGIDGSIYGESYELKPFPFPFAGKSLSLV